MLNFKLAKHRSFHYFHGAESELHRILTDHACLKHRLITLRNGIGNAIHCQSIIIVSLAYDVIDNVLYRDGHGFFERT